jgi:hypothetical protein
MPTIYQLPIQQPAMVGVFPNQKFAVFGDNLAAITAAGYLNSVNLESNPISATDVLQVLYSYNNVTKSGSFGIFTVSISNSGVITLVEWSNPGDVLLPVVSGDFAVFNGTTGQIKDAGYLPSNAAKTNVVMLSAAPTVGHLASFADVAGTVQDAGIASSAVMLNNAANVMTGAGQITLAKANGTEASNAVTASGNAGVITTSVLTTAGGASYAITWTNTLITSTSVILLTIMGGTNTTENITLKSTAGSGTSTLTIYNNTAATALNGTILIGYSVL